MLALESLVSADLFVVVRQAGVVCDQGHESVLLAMSELAEALQQLTLMQ
jgi:hypothetical protein